VRRRLLPALIACAAAALIALLAYGIDSQGENTSIDAQIARGQLPMAPNAHDSLRVLGSDGRRASLADFRGKVVVLNIFASWCTECIGESGALEREQQQLQHRGGTVLGVTYLDNSLDAQRFVSEHHLGYPVIQDVDGNLVRAFGTDAVPETFVIDRAGRVAAVRRYSVDGAWLQQAVAKAMAQPV
jgi:cytochrome c biogenesis protein CcmG/thiol:disulfide interchange protein DsbE